MVAAVCSWHEHHAAAVAEIEGRLERGEQIVAPGPALADAYAVLTRLPAPHKLSPSDAWALIEANFVIEAIAATLPADSYRTVLADLARTGIAGGRTMR